MQSQEVSIKPTINIVLKPDTETLDEVVVIAYGTAKKESLTGSISVVDNKKIEKLFSFRIPYYVGPLRTGNGENSKFAWAERKSTEKIYPWNFENVIDVEQSAENFIRRMTNKCTYLIGEDVLPKDSLLYSKFMVLNELNNLRLDGQKISVELKQKIYRDVFCRSRKVTQKNLI